MRNLLLALGMILVLSAPAGANWSAQAKLTAAPPIPHSQFGRSVSISGQYAIVGAADENNSTGAAYIFYYDGVTWSQQARLTAGDADQGDFFGSSVSINGNYAIVGAKYNNNIGAAYIFNRSGTTWPQQTKLIDPGGVASDCFGYSVSIEGDYVIVGAIGDVSFTGAAYIFKRSVTSWSQKAKLTASDGVTGDWFGNSVSIIVGNAIVGALRHNSNAGAAYAFQRGLLPVWADMTETGKLTASDGSAGDFFGASVSITGGIYAIVGAPYNGPTPGDWRGGAYVFKRPFPSWANATETAKLTASDGAPNDEFGISVSINGNDAIVGACFDNDTGSAYVFQLNTTWVEQAKLTPSVPSGQEWFGMAVSTDGHCAIIGAPDDTLSGPYPYGSAYIFSDCDCGVWGDVTGEGEINPLDVVCIVNYVYKNLDARVQPPNCPYEAGDVNCDGAVNPLDVVHYVNYVYKNITPWPCGDPCNQ